MKKIISIALIAIFVSSYTFAQKVDYLIKNGYVFDGTGTDSVAYDIGILKNRIVFIGNSTKSGIQAVEVIDAKGKYVAPGFIDPHTHIERLLNSDDKEQRAALIWLRQGVTTVLTGNDGYRTVNTAKTFSDWEKNGIGPNVAMYVGFGPVRSAVMGDMPVQPNQKQIVKMQELVEKSMKDGAIGFSTGLSYLPQTFSKTPEVVALAKSAAKYDGMYDTHMRAQSWPSSKVAIEEVLEIEKESGIKVHISHIKSSGEAAWGKSANIIKILDNARKKGSTIAANVYPYTASNNGLRGILPLWSREAGTKEMVKYFDDSEKLEQIKISLTKKLGNGGGATQMLSTRSKSMAEINGKTIEEVSKIWGMSQEDVVIAVLKRNPTIGVISFGMQEEDVINFLKQPYIVVGSDGSESHPRGAGSFAKVINEYAIDQKIMPLKQMIYKCTGLTAKMFNLKDRGIIKEGAIADIVIFDPKMYKSNSTYQNPAAFATGIQSVFVNGDLVIKNDKYNGKLPGKVIRYNQQ